MGEAMATLIMNALFRSSFTPAGRCRFVGLSKVGIRTEIEARDLEERISENVAKLIEQSI